MSLSFADQLRILRELHDLVEKKEPAPAEMYGQVGLNDKARLKDIQKKITEVKKKVSMDTKNEIAREEEEEFARLAAENKMTVDEFKEHLKAPKKTCGDHQEKQKALERGLAEARAKKDLTRAVNMGEYDLHVDYV